MRKIYIAILVCLTMLASTGCKEKYVSPLEAPDMTLAAADAAYNLDFDQLNNDVLDTLQEKEIYGFVKEMEITGDNEVMEINYNVEIEENVSDDAVELLLTDAVRAIVDAANTQDFRIESYSDENFGNLSDIYNINLLVKCGDETVKEYKIEKGESIPFDPTLTLENVIG